MPGKKINGDGKVILFRLGEIDETLKFIQGQLKDISAKQSAHSVDIKGITTKQDSIQGELTEHKNGHKYFGTIIVAISGVISTIVMFIVNHYQK